MIDPEYQDTMNFYNNPIPQNPYSYSGGINPVVPSMPQGNPYQQFSTPQQTPPSMLGLATTGVGLLGSLIAGQNDPKDIKYNRSAGVEMAIDNLMSLPGFQEQLSSLNQGSGAAIGLSRRQGKQDIEGSMATPGQIAKFLSQLYSETAGQSAINQARNYQTAYQGAQGQASALGSLALSEQAQQQQLQMFNQQQNLNNNPLGDVFGTLGQIGAFLI